MKIGYIHLADYANISVEGKPNILGLFTRIYVNSVPMVYGNCVLVFELIPELMEPKKPSQVCARLIDPDGKKLAEFSLNIDGSGMREAQCVIIRLDKLYLPVLGRYEVSVEILSQSGQPATVAFEVVEMSKQRT